MQISEPVKKPVDEPAQVELVKAKPKEVVKERGMFDMDEEEVLL